MTTHFDFDAMFESAKESLAYKVELAVLDFTEELVARMACKGVTRAELARQIGCSPAYVTKILRGSTNFTLETMVKVADVLGCKMRTHLQPDGTRTHWFDMQENAQKRVAVFQTGAEMKELVHQYSLCREMPVNKETAYDTFPVAS